MSEFVITTESTCDLPDDIASEKGIDIFKLSYTIDGNTYKDKEGIPINEFYDRIHNGEESNTSQINPEEATNLFEKHLAAGKDVLHLMFSSGLTGGLQSLNIAKMDLEEKYPDRKIIIVDTLGASLGQGLIVYYSALQQEAGQSIEEVAKYAEEIRFKVAHDFTVDDLMHLYRGGRLSKTSAILGGALGIKPVLNMNDEGKLIPVSKERGRKKAVLTTIKRLIENISGFEKDNPVIGITNANAPDDAEFAKQKIKEHFDSVGVSPIFIENSLSTVIGSHSGYATLALFSMGKGRNI